jgi:hypothetical protein
LAVEAGRFLADLYADRLNADRNLGKKQVESVGMHSGCNSCSVMLWNTQT